MSKRVIIDKKICIGKDKQDGSNVYLELNISEVDDSQTESFRLDSKGNRYDITKGISHETINHDIVTKYKTLSLSGYSKSYAGQILDDLNSENINFKCDEQIINEIVKIWKEYHLNDLQPNCIHQESFNCNHDYDNQSKIQTLKCPNGYQYGSKWLIKDLPQEIIDRITELFSMVK